MVRSLYKAGVPQRYEAEVCTFLLAFLPASLDALWHLSLPGSR